MQTNDLKIQAHTLQELLHFYVCTCALLSKEGKSPPKCQIISSLNIKRTPLNNQSYHVDASLCTHQIE